MRLAPDAFHPPIDPSMVVTALPAAAETGTLQERTGSTIDMQSAGPALSNATAELGAGKPELITDHPEQRRFRRYVDASA